MCERTASVRVLVSNFGDIMEFDAMKNAVYWDVMLYCLVER